MRENSFDGRGKGAASNIHSLKKSFVSKHANELTDVNPPTIGSPTYTTKGDNIDEDQFYSLKTSSIALSKQLDHGSRSGIKGKSSNNRIVGSNRDEIISPNRKMSSNVYRQKVET